MARARGRGLAGAGADGRPRGGRRPPPRHAQRASSATLPPWASCAAGSTWRAIRAGSATSPLGGKPLTFGNLEKAVPGARTPGRLPRVGRRAVRPERDLGRHRLGARALGRAAGRQGRARSRGRAARGRRRRRRRSSSPTTAAASSTRCPRPSARCPTIVDAVGDQLEVLVDGGVRTGLDVVKMLALGARAVLIGRAWAWAVAARGEAGVRHMLEVIQADIDVALALTGSRSVADSRPLCAGGGPEGVERMPAPREYARPADPPGRLGLTTRRLSRNIFFAQMLAGAELRRAGPRRPLRAARGDRRGRVRPRLPGPRPAPGARRSR